MKKLDRKKLLALSIIVGSLAVAGATSVGAYYKGGIGAGDQLLNEHQEMVAALSKKFNLNSTDVDKFFEEQMTQRRATMEARMLEMEKARLSQAVADGKLTQAQADLITQKHAELRATRASSSDTLKGKTKEEIQTIMKAQMDSLKEWAADNKIPEAYMFGLGMGAGNGQHRGGMMGKKMGQMLP
ncbi:MAG: hypothetical protein WC783_01385 [Candidatus Paceibacterota bacterium]|jgi:hypothetical protein